MRCAAPVTYYAFTDAAATNLVKFQGVQLGPDVAECLPNELAFLSYAEIGNITENPFRMGLQDAGAISTAILLIWALGFGIRQIIRVISAGDTGLNEGEL